MSIKIFLRLTCTAAMAVLLGGCPFGGSGDIAPAFKQISAETQVLLAKKGMTQEAPILVRIFKEESELEIWKEKSDGRYYHFKTYPICTWSGDLGPKVKQGDKQAPEGFYTVTPGQMNPNSQFHLAFNLGYPNAYDKANGRTGSALMVHGDCRSAGCFAMTDALIEEIYALGREAFRGGQKQFNVHAFPFRMTAANMKRHRGSKWYGFWKTLKVGYDDFELTRQPPKVAVCSKQYLVNAEFLGHVATPDPASTCPAFRRAPGAPFTPVDQRQLTTAAASAPAPANRVVAYSERNETQTTSQSTSVSASKPQRKEIDQPDQAAVSPQLAVATSPATTKRAAPRQEQRVIQAGVIAAPNTSETSAKPDSDQSAPTAALIIEDSAEGSREEKAQGDQKTVQVRENEDPGMHHVQKSGKGDMLVPNNQAR